MRSIMPRPLLALVILNFFGSAAHAIHNMAFLPEYREPSFINPGVIDLLWMAATALVVA